MKFYKGDHVKIKHYAKLETVQWSDDMHCKLIGTPMVVDIDRLTLIRRADEPEWPSDVPRCELTLPLDERYVFTGYQHWSSPGQLFCDNGKWRTSHGPVAGDPKLPTCKAVNDEDYVPPQLSETTNSSQVESKITVNRLTELYHKDLHESNVAQILDGHVVIQSMDIRLKPHHALALAELLTAAAKEAQQ